MDLFDFVNELRMGTPDIKKTEKAMKLLGWICVVAAIWNFAIYYIAPFKAGPLNLPPQYPYVAFISLLLLGTLFFRSASGIKNLESWGKKTGQVAIVLLLGIFFGFMFVVFPSIAISIHDITFSTIFIICIALTLSQFAISGILGVRYLERLPAKDNNCKAGRYRCEIVSHNLRANGQREEPASKIQYDDSPFPFGIVGTFVIVMVGPLLSMPIVEKISGQQIMPFIVMSTLFLTILGPLIYNLFPSPFEKERTVVASYTGGGAVFLFYCSWPFLRLHVYIDGLEVRVMFHRDFIPYDKMSDISDKVSFNRGILIKSDLPDVPSGIRFIGFGMKGIIKKINEAKNRYRSGDVKVMTENGPAESNCRIFKKA